MTSHDLAAEIRAKERAELDRSIDKAEREQTETEQTYCRFCGRRWFTYPLSGKSVPATYLREAGCITHLVCWCRQESR